MDALEAHIQVAVRALHPMGFMVSFRNYRSIAILRDVGKLWINTAINVKNIAAYVRHQISQDASSNMNM